MGTVFGIDTGLDLPGLAASSIGTSILMGLFIVLILGGIALGIWWWTAQRLFKFDIVVYENIAGQGWKIGFRDKAKYLRLSKDGTEVLYLKKKKIPLTAYGKKMALNQYWFAIGEDGGWYNFVLGDLDAKMGTLDIELIDRDVKYITVAMRKNAAENYGPKVSFMDKWGTWIIGATTMIIMLAGIYFLLEQMGQIASSLASSQAEFSKIVDPVTKALAHVDSICSGGTGVVAA